MLSFPGRSLRSAGLLDFHAARLRQMLALCLASFCLLLTAIPAFAADDESEEFPPSPPVADAGDSDAGEMEAEEDEEDTDEELAADETEAGSGLPQPSKIASTATEDGPGVMGNIGFMGMQTFGREDSIAPAEIMPYLLLDEDFLFSNIRGFISTEGRFGGNFGAGYRRLVPNQNAWYGINAWYDADDTSGKLFHQLGFGVEAAFRSFELRSNAYFPVGNTDQTLSRSATNARFSGTQLVFDQIIQRGYALRGVDVEAGYALPLPALGEDSVLRWYVGGYFFGGNSGAESISGFQTRAEAQIATTVTSHVQFTNDREYGSNIMVGMTVDFPWGEAHPAATWRRNTPSPFRFVHRNYNVILDRRDESQFGVAAINPLTGDEYQVAHVDTSGAGTGTGAVDTPWSSITDAQNSGADLIFVHSGSVIDQAITLGDGVSLIGDSGSQWISVGNGQSALLPSFNSVGPDNAPRFANITGDAITLGNGSTVSGFQFDQITGNGIVGSGIENTNLRDLSFGNISGDAIRLNNATGTLQLENIATDGIGGHGLFVMGGNATMNLISSTFENTTGDAIRLQNIEGGVWNLTQTTVNETAGHGLVLQDVNGTVNVSNLKVTGSDSSAVYITGGDDGESSYNFTNGTYLTDVDGGVQLLNTSADITFGLLDIATSGVAPGLEMDNVDGVVQFSNLLIDSETGPGAVFRDVDDLTISGGKISTVGAAAFDAENTVMSVALHTVSVDDAAFAIRLDDVTGTFSVIGDGNKSGGTIQNSDVGVLLNNAETVTLQYMTFTDNGTGIQSQGTDLLAVAGIEINGSTGYAIDSLNDTKLSVRSSNFDENGSTAGGTIRVRADADSDESYHYEFVGLQISDLNGTPISVTNSGAAAGTLLDATFTGNIMEATKNGVAGIHVNWNGSTTVNATSNTIVATGTNSRGILIESSATTDALAANLSANVIQVSGNNASGIRIVSTQESKLQLLGNSVVTSGSGGTGLHFDLSGVSDVWMMSNTITDVGSSGSGIVFDQIADASRVQFDANTINMQSTSATVDRGIRFVSVIATDETGDGVTPKIQLFGNYNNTVTGATDPFFIPAGRSTGRFYLNGSLVPQ